MVFESVVANVLNRILSEYFENLDASQLNFGFWRGDVVLNDLILKSAVYDDVEIPFKIVAGKLGSLYMKIPWTNPYKSPTELKFKDLLILIGPSSYLKYDAVAAAMAAESTKRKELLRMDELRRKEEAKKRGECAKYSDNTFTGMLITRTLKNMHITIENVHICYEDGTINPDSPFAFGIMLKRLEIQSTDTNWTPSTLPDVGGTFYMLSKLERLSVHWDSDTELIKNCDVSTVDKLYMLHQYVISHKAELSHMIRPINATAKMAITPRPDRGPKPFSIPKYWAEVDVEEMALEINKMQYQDMVKLSKHVDLLLKGHVYRKYRPSISQYQYHYKQWWQFAYECIVEEEVRRKSENWDWYHIKRHRDICKTYSKAYYQKLTERLTSRVERTISQCERVLYIFNINLIRTQVETRIKKEGVGAGWISGWLSWIPFGSGERRNKLNETYEDCSIAVSVTKIVLKMSEYAAGSYNRRNILSIEIDNPQTIFKRMPDPLGVSVTFAVDGITCLGCEDNPGMLPPVILSSTVTDDEYHLLTGVYEYKSLKSLSDHKIKINGDTIEIFYDFKTISKLIELFTVPIHYAAATNSQEIMVRSDSCLQYMLDGKQECEIDVRFRAIRFLIPQNGRLDRDGVMLKLEMGAIKLCSIPREKNWKIKRNIESSIPVPAEDVYINKMLKLAYDTFTFIVSSFRMQLALPSKDYKTIVSNNDVNSDFHKPKSIKCAEPIMVTYSRFLLPDHAKLPRIQMDTKLPSLTMDISEHMLVELMQLLTSLPSPPAKDPGDENVSANSLKTELVLMVMKFSVNALKLRITAEPELTQPFVVDVSMKNLLLGITNKSHRKDVDVSSGGLTAVVIRNSAPVYLLKTPMSSKSHRYLVMIHFTEIYEHVPPAASKRYIKADVSSLDVVLHQQALTSLLSLLNRISKCIEVTGNEKPSSSDSSGAVNRHSSTYNGNARINLEIVAKMESCSVQLSSEKINLLKATITAADVSMIQENDERFIALGLTTLKVRNLNPDGIYKDIFSDSADSVLQLTISIPDKCQKGATNAQDMETPDMTVSVDASGANIVYIRAFVDEVIYIVTNFDISNVEPVNLHESVVTDVNENIEDVSPSPRKILLSVDLRDAKFIIPRNKHSQNGLCTAVEYLTLRNQFTKKEVDDLGQYAIIEKMEIDMDQSKVSRMYFNEDEQGIQSQVQLWDSPVCVICVDRNLSLGLHKFIPAYDVDVSVGKATARMSNADYNLILGCIFENVTVPYPANPQDAPVVDPNDKLFVAMRVSVLVNEMQFEMHHGDFFKLEDTTGLVERDHLSAFAIATMENIGVNSKTFSDQSRSCHVVVESMSFDDIRPGKRAITNLIHTRLHPNKNVMGDADPVVKIKYTMSPNTGTKLKLEATCLSIIFDLDYIQKISQLFRASGSKVEHENLSGDSISSPSEADVEKHYSWKATYKLFDTEIILVETLESADSRALLLNLDGTIRQNNSNGNSKTRVNLKKLSLASFIYNPEYWESSTAEVVSPISVRVVWNTTEMMDSVVDVKMSKMLVRLTAGTVELISNILRSIGTTGNFVQDDYSDFWEPREISDHDFWFLSAEDKKAMGQENETVSGIAANRKGYEAFRFQPDSIVFIFETGAGSTPLMRIDACVNLEILDWSHLMKMNGRMRIGLACYNTMSGIWEHVIENPWEILLNHSKRANQQYHRRPESLTTYVVVRSDDVLELTVTKTILAAMDRLAYDFSCPVKELASRREMSKAQYNIINETGMEVILIHKEGGSGGYFKLADDGDAFSMFTLRHGTDVNLDFHECQEMNPTLSLEIPEIDFSISLPLHGSTKRLYPLRDNVCQGLLCDMGDVDITKVVTVRSLVQIINMLDIAVDVYCICDEDDEKLVGSVGRGSTFNIPLSLTNSENCSIFFVPEGCYAEIRNAFYLNYFMKNERRVEDLQFDTEQATFYMTVVSETYKVPNEVTKEQSQITKCCSIYLKPHILLENLLPIPIRYFVGGTDREVKFAKGGCSIAITDIRGEKGFKNRMILQIPNHQNKSWTCESALSKMTGKISTVRFVSDDGTDQVLTLQIHRASEKKQTLFQLFSSFWMINKTGLNLQYKEDGTNSDITYHSKDENQPIIFSFPGRSIFSKKKFVNVKVKEAVSFGSIVSTDWSSRFSLDENAGVYSVSCRSSFKNFQLAVEIKTCAWGLTRQVIFTPRFCISNQCPFSVHVFEPDETTDALEVASGRCIPFWPKSQIPHLIAAVKILNRVSETPMFKCDMTDNILLQLPNEVGGIQVDIVVAECTTIITFTKFDPTHAPALLINKCGNLAIEFTEGAREDIFLLCPGQQQYFAWKNHMRSKKLRWWPAGKFKTIPAFQKNDLLKDESGVLDTIHHKPRINRRCYWISFMHGSQRFLLFTEDPNLLKLVTNRNTGNALYDYTLQFHGVRLSLLDKETLTLMRISRSAPVWEQCTNEEQNQFRSLTEVDHKTIEAAYQVYLDRKSVSASTRTTKSFDSGLLVDFDAMRAIKPLATPISRIVEPGVFINYKIQAQETQVKAKLFRVHVDHPIHDSVFQVVLAPMKAMEIDTPAKPFIEVNVTKMQNSRSNVEEYKCAEMFVQECIVNVDSKLVMAMMKVFGGGGEITDNWSESFINEYKSSCMPIDQFLCRQIQPKDQQYYFAYLHLPRLKAHLSLSMVGFKNISNPLLKLGVSLTDMKNSELELPCFEIRNTLITHENLYKDVRIHYLVHCGFELDELLLGFEVIRYPHGLAKDSFRRLDRWLLPPTQAALSFDDQHQIQRREIVRKWRAAAERFKIAQRKHLIVTKFLKVVDAVITKSIEGGKKKGVPGFFQGAVDGAVEQLAKPAIRQGGPDTGSLPAHEMVTTTDDLDEFEILTL